MTSSTDLTQPFTVPLIGSDTVPDVETEVPAVLREVLDANHHLKSYFAAAVSNALKQSLEHPDTKMRTLTVNEIRRRAALAYEAMIAMYFEEKMALIRACDMLPAVLLDALRMDYGAGDITDGKGERKRWGVQGSEQVCEADMGTDVTEADSTD